MGLIFIIPLELGMVIVGINSLYVFILTLGSPLWKKQRQALGWSGLGAAPGGIFAVIETVFMVIQIIFGPVYLFLQLVLLFIPMLISSSFYFEGSMPSFNFFWNSLFSTSGYWNDAVASIPWWCWVLQVVWLFIMICAWDLTSIHFKKYYDMWSPLTAYLWLILRIFAGKIWGFYKLILIKTTVFCYLIHTKLGGCGGYLGDLLLVPVFLVWAYWSLIFLIFKNYFALIGIIPVCLFLTWMGYLIVKENWKEVSFFFNQEKILYLFSKNLFFKAKIKRRI